MKDKFMSVDYYLAAEMVVDACQGVALLGTNEDPSIKYDTLDAQFRFVEAYCARLFKINVEPYAWLSVEEKGDGVNVSVFVERAVWSSISARDYATFSATKKDNRRKNKAGENPDLGMAFDKWWEIVSNICQKAKGEALSRVLGLIGFMVALQRSGKWNYRKGSKVSRETVGKIARASSLRLGQGSPASITDIVKSIEIFLKKSCGAFVVDAGESEDAPIPPPYKSSQIEQPQPVRQQQFPVPNQPRPERQREERRPPQPTFSEPPTQGQIDQREDDNPPERKVYGESFIDFVLRHLPLLVFTLLGEIILILRFNNWWLLQILATLFGFGWASEEDAHDRFDKLRFWSRHSEYFMLILPWINKMNIISDTSSLIIILVYPISVVFLNHFDAIKNGNADYPKWYPWIVSFMVLVFPLWSGVFAQE